MISLEKIPRGTAIIITLSLLIPLLSTAFPHLSKLFVMQMNFFAPINTAMSVFMASFDLQLLIACLMRFQILSSIEAIKRNEVEVLFYTSFFVFPLLISHILEGLRSFSDSINMADVYMLSRHQSEFNIFGFNVKNHILPYVYLGMEIVLSNGRTKAYYGLLYGVIYFKLRQYGLCIPDWFYRVYFNLNARINKPAIFRGRGRKIRK